MYMVCSARNVKSKANLLVAAHHSLVDVTEKNEILGSFTTGMLVISLAIGGVKMQT